MLDEVSMIKHHNVVCTLNSGEPMCHYDYCLPTGQQREGLLEYLLAHAVQGVSGFVKNQ